MTQMVFGNRRTKTTNRLVGTLFTLRLPFSADMSQKVANHSRFSREGVYVSFLTKLDKYVETRMVYASRRQTNTAFNQFFRVGGQGFMVVGEPCTR